MLHDPGEFGEETESVRERPWIALTTTYDVEAWIDHQNRELQRYAADSRPERCGLCFRLLQGGSLYVHTTMDGEVVLDVPDDATWVVPLITAVTSMPQPATQWWRIPADCLTQLVLGLSPLIAATCAVKNHDFGMRHY